MQATARHAQARAGHGFKRRVAMLALACSGVASAEITITDGTRHYPLRAHTLPAFRSALQAGIPEARPEHPSGMTQVKLEWNATYQPTAAGCRVASHHVKLGITTVLPEWAQRASAPVALRRQWDRAYAAIAAHEAGHRDISVQGARELDTMVAGFASPKPCQAAALDLDWQVWKLQQRQQRAQERFDRVTGSGRKRGAVL